MNKPITTGADAPVAQPVAVASAQITLIEFCTRLSEKVRRPELISAFEYIEKRAGRIKGTGEAFQARFDEFVKTPV